ncbi:hypothetical protein BG004_002666 [Podila humilis]|nr:hypothetical protein BG004_002666 [Podila humilis]
MSLDYFYTGLIAPLLCLTAITLPIPGIDMGRLKQAAPRLQKICLSGSEAGVASYYQSPPAEQTKEGSDQDVNGDLNSAESISRSRPMTVSMFPSSPFSLQRLDVDAVLDCSTLCYILSNIPTIQHLSLLGFHTFLPDSPEHNTRFPELIEQYGSCFKAITELRCMASILFFDRDLQTVLPYMPQLRQLSIPQIFQESTTFKVLHESCPHLEAVHLINHWNGLSQVEFQRQGFFELMLREMPQLKTMDYNGVFIDASLFGKDAENNDKEDIADWTCVDLEQLRCQITGMVRLTEEEKETYKVLVRRGGHTAPAAAEDTGNRLKQERTVLEKINRKTLQERELYRRFARLRRVRVVDFGFRVFGSPRGGPGEHGWITTSNVARKCNSLELSMTSGLEKLLEAWKGSLEEIGFSTEGQTGIGAIEVLSMVEHWPRLERVKVCVFPGEETKWRHIRELVRKKRSSVHVEIAVRELRDDTVEMEMILNQREWRMT